MGLRADAGEIWDLILLNRRDRTSCWLILGNMRRVTMLLSANGLQEKSAWLLSPEAHFIKKKSIILPDSILRRRMRR